MEFKYSIGNRSNTSFFEERSKATIADLREIIYKDLFNESGLNNFYILDLGRIVKDDELLSELDRNVFTIQYSKR